MRRRQRVRGDMTVKEEVRVMALLEGGCEPWEPLETGRGEEANSTLEPLEGRKLCLPILDF